MRNFITKGFTDWESSLSVASLFMYLEVSGQLSPWSTLHEVQGKVHTYRRLCYKTNLICFQGRLINGKILATQRTFYQCKDLCRIRTLSQFLFLHLEVSKSELFALNINGYLFRQLCKAQRTKEEENWF